MPFNTAEFSTNGLNLLSQLTSSKSLRIKNIYIDEVEHTASDLEQTPAWWSTQTSATMAKVDAVLAAAGEIDDQARLVVKISLKSGQTQTVTAKTIILTACGVESGVETSEITFCGVSDNNGVEVLYNASGIKLSTSAALYFDFNNASSITFEEAIDPDYVVHSELDRFLSCHAIGDVSGGVNQTVNGNKTFRDGVTVNIANQKVLSFKFNGNEQAWIGDTGHSGIQFNSVNVVNGDDCFKFVNNNNNILKMTYSNDGNANHYVTTISGQLSTTLTTANTIVCYNAISTPAIASSTEIVSVSASVIPNSDSTYNLGEMYKRWSNIYSDEVWARHQFVLDSLDARNNKLTIYEDEGDIVIGGFTTVDNSNDHGVYLAPLYNTSTQQHGDRASLYCGALYSKTVETTGDITTEGSVIASNLNGVIPTPNSTTNIPVGCICVLKSSTETLRGDQISKMPNEQGWMNRRTSASIGLYFSDLEPESADRTLVYSDFNLNTRFMALSHADANKAFLAIRTA